MGWAMDTDSINPAFIIDEAVDLSMRLTGTAFSRQHIPSKNPTHYQ